MEARIFTFEPTKSCFDELNSKFSGKGNVKINHFGLSDHAGEVDIYYDEEKSGLASVHLRNLKYYNIEAKMSEKVSLIRAKEFISQNAITHINLIKIDVEGHELSALRGFDDFLSGETVDYIQFEYGGGYMDSRITLRDMFELLDERGFKLFKIMPNCLEYRKWEP